MAEKIRLYLHQKITPLLSLDPAQQHYLFNVMRMKAGGRIFIFNEGGEYEAEIVSKNSLKTCSQQLSQASPMPHKPIAISLIKNSRLELAIEKCVELAATDIYLILADFSNNRRPNLSRLQKIAIEATEQCGRLSPPVIHKPQPLEAFLSLAHTNKSLSPIQLAPDGQYKDSVEGVCAIVGPEGGFSEREKALMKDLPKMRIAEYVLRAETAVIAALVKR